MITFAALFFGSTSWILPAAILCIVGILVLLWSYGQYRRQPVVRITAGSLKCLALVALALCLVEPLWNGTRAVPGANIFLIVSDNSQSMKIRDLGSDQGRGELARALLLDEQSAWQTRLRQDFEVRQFCFDSRLRGLSSFAELDFSGNESALHGAIHSMRDRFHERPIAGVLLFTDGNSTDLPDDLFNAGGLPPIYPVIVGSSRAPRDLSITNVAVSQTSFEDAPVSLRVEVMAREFAGEQVAARVTDPEGKTLPVLSQTAGSAEEVLVFRFDIEQRIPGTSFYKVEVALKRDMDRAPDESSDEATLENNSRWVAVDRGANPHRILYVAGRPNWEFKFLQRALDEEPEIDLTAIIRIAKREPKFTFRGRMQDRRNPLFLGSDQTEEDTQEYDEPVIVRINPPEGNDLRSGFPKAPEALYEFDAVILDDLEARFFTQDQMNLLRRFVSQRGGGFMMLAGLESFRQGGFDRTPIEEMLPVYLDQAPNSKPSDRMRLSLTREGWLQPWVRLRRTQDEEKLRLNQMPDFHTVNRVRGIKPGAQELAKVADAEGKTYPALVAQRFGRGRAAAMLVGDLWLWRMHSEPENRDLDKAWRQVARWLVADVPERVDLQAQRNKQSASLVNLETRIRDKQFEPVANAAVSLQITRPDGTQINMVPDASDQEVGLFETSVMSHEAGCYRAEVTALDEAGELIGKNQKGWTADPAADEFADLELNLKLLEQIAQKTGGEVVKIAGLDSLVAALPSRKAPITEQYAYPLWHKEWAFLAIIGCMVCEWGLRRWKGMP